MGYLTVTAQLDLRQFWPFGGSDADTLTLHVQGGQAFRFADAPGSPGRITRAFEGAYIRVRGRKQAVLGNGGTLKVRLQGVDAPELHYRPVNRLPELRQHGAEAAVLALGDWLRRAGSGPTLACEAVTQVAEPNDVFDMYARFIGDVEVTAPRRLNLNQWLVQQGWALPSFYNSMTAAEIGVLTSLTEQARAARAGVWRRGGYTSALMPLDSSLTYRRPGSQPASDRGPMILPKLFRRQYMWAEELARGTTTARTLRDYLLDPMPSRRDKFQDAAEHLAQPTGGRVRDLAEAIRKDNRLGLRPERIVFQEADATLYGPDHRPIRSW